MADFWIVVDKMYSYNHNIIKTTFNMLQTTLLVQTNIPKRNLQMNINSKLQKVSGIRIPEVLLVQNIGLKELNQYSVQRNNIDTLKWTYGTYIGCCYKPHGKSDGCGE